MIAVVVAVVIGSVKDVVAVSIVVVIVAVGIVITSAVSVEVVVGCHWKRS